MTVVEELQKPPQKRLDIGQKLDVQYCIPAWIRDTQIRANIARIKGRIQECKELKTEPIALVSFGPSLQDTWEEIRNFKYVMTCSGAHPFLIERGIVPNWHIAVDPLPGNTVKLIGQPHLDVEYLIASTCNPDVLDHLKDYNVKLWHVLDTAEEGWRLLPHGEWAITGGCSVGLRTMTIARFFGFRDLHIFGMDGNARGDAKHAGDHPNLGKPQYTTTYEGKEYLTTPAMLEAAKQTWHEMDMLKDVTAKFYGEGLIQDMAKKYVRKDTIKNGAAGFFKVGLISENYRALNEQLHRENIYYGVNGRKHAETVLKLAQQLKSVSEFVSVLDYGCGKGTLAQAIPFPIQEYDPAVPGKTESPRPADLVVCTDVLEHIEPAHIDSVLNDIARCVKHVGFFVISTRLAQKTLPDGRNTHILVKGQNWWAKKLAKHFTVGKITEKNTELFVVVGPKKK